ncbi:bestrophin-like domain [Brevundimonas sp.]|uniref:bestrophin-like domain n=1 Tax=Brevundimonas sp. TaxID=1871086 RepID=UPI002FCA6FE9
MDGLTAFINDAPLLLIAGLLFLAQCLMREVGGWIRRRVSADAGESAEEVSDKGYLLSGVLGLLALLIAFTFGLAVDRYEGRRHLVTEEANAIGTAEMRVQLLPPPDGARLADMLRDYARTRAAYGLADTTDRPSLARSSAVQRSALQTAALSSLAPVSTTALAAFVGASINAVLDIGVEREAMNDARVPLTILRALVLYALLTAAMLGYGLTGARARHRATTVILFTLLSLAILLILDLDRPQGGTIRIDQTPMTQLVAGFPPKGQTAP